MIKKQFPPHLREQLFNSMDMVGCIIHPSINTVAFVLLQEHLTLDEIEERGEVGDDFLVRLIGIKETPDKESLEVGWVDIESPDLYTFLGISALPDAKIMILRTNGEAMVFNRDGSSWTDEQVGELPFLEKVKTIGDYTWAVGMSRSVYKRQEVGEWIKVDNGLNTDEHFSTIGFIDIDGFDGNDIYAVGGIGDVWHYDGEKWSVCLFPTTDRLDAVCCASDGFVYIATASTKYFNPSVPRWLWKGRNNQWELVCELQNAEKTINMGWFDERLWIQSAYGIHIWDKRGLLTNRLEPDGPQIPYGRGMHIGNDMLMLYSSTSIWTYDGKEWNNILSLV